MPRAASKSRATGGMQAQGDRPETPLLAVGHSGKAVLPQPMPRDRQAEVVGQVTRTTRAGGGGVGGGNHGRRHRTPRIGMKRERPTEGAFIGGNDDRITHAVRRPSQLSEIDTCNVGQSRRLDVAASRRSLACSIVNEDATVTTRGGAAYISSEAGASICCQNDIGHPFCSCSTSATSSVKNAGLYSF